MDPQGKNHEVGQQNLRTMNGEVSETNAPRDPITHLPRLADPETTVFACFLF